MFELLINKQEYRNMQESLYELMKHDIIILQTPLDPMGVNSFQDRVNIFFSSGNCIWSMSSNFFHIGYKGALNK